MSVFPTTVIPPELSVTSHSYSFLSEGEATGKEYSREVGRHIWRLRLSFPEFDKDQWGELFGFLLAHNGSEGSFFYAPPDLATPRGTATGSPVVDGGSQTGGSLDVTGCTADQAAFLKAGDVFTIAGDFKVYMVTADAASNGSGEATLSIIPDLQASPASGAALTVTNVRFLVSHVGGTEYSVAAPLNYKGFEVILEEVDEIINLYSSDQLFYATTAGGDFYTSRHATKMYFE